MSSTAKEGLDKIKVLASRRVKVSKSKIKEYRIIDVTRESLSLALQAVREDSVYGVDERLLNEVLKKSVENFDFGKNIDRHIIALKIGLIDVTNSTHLSQHKSKFSIAMLAEKIAGNKDFDMMIASGEPSVVKWLAKDVLGEISLGDGEDDKNVRLYSFASKYCCYHNSMVYGRDDFSKFDGIVSYCLPLYLNYLDIRPSDYYKTKSKKWSQSGLMGLVKSGRYDIFNSLISEVLNRFGINDNIENDLQFKRIAFDYLMWYPNR